MLDAVIQLKVVVLQRGGGARREPAVGAGAVEEQSGADGPQQDAQGAHHDDGEEDGVQRVEPGVVLVLLGHQGDRGGVHVRGGGGGEGGLPTWKDMACEIRKERSRKWKQYNRLDTSINLIQNGLLTTKRLFQLLIFAL